MKTMGQCGAVAVILACAAGAQESLMKTPGNGPAPKSVGPK